MGKSIFAGLENHFTRLEDEEASTETTVDVEVAVAQSQDEQAELDKSVHEVEEIVESSDAGAEVAEQVEMFRDVIKKHGLPKALLAVLNHNGGLAAISGRAIPSVESIDATGASHSETQAVLESLGDTLRNWYQAIVKFLKSVWAKIQDLFRWVMSKIVSYKSTVGSLKSKLDSMQSVDEEKMKDKKANSMSVEKFDALCSTLMTLFGSVGNVINKGAETGKSRTAQLETAEGREQAMKDVESEIKKELNSLGFETKDNGDIKGAAKDAPELKSEKLTEYKWDRQSLLAKHSTVSQLIAKLEAFPKVQSAIKTLISAAEKEAEALVATGAAKDEEAKKNKGTVEFQRQVVSFSSRVASKMVQRSGEAARAWINAATAVIACAKAA